MIRWRLYNPSTDLLAMAELHAEMEKKLGRSLELPTLDEKPVLCTVVGETDGKITHGLFIEATIECCAIGTTVLPAKELDKAIDDYLLPVAQFYKIRMARAWVPTAMLGGKLMDRKKPIQRTLERCGFELENGIFSCFSRWIRKS